MTKNTDSANLKTNKTPISYYGGKQKMVKHILPLIPKHHIYVEPFFGGGAIFFAKEPSHIEVINDLNGEVVNFYAVMQNDFEALQKKISTQIHSRQIYRDAAVVNCSPHLFSKLERACAFWVLTNQGFGSQISTSSWGYSRIKNSDSLKNKNKREAFGAFYGERISLTQIENNNALQVIKSRDTPQTFVYADPPYHNACQGHYKGYTQADYIDLLEVLKNMKGKFLLSSYPCETLAKYTQENGWNTQKVEGTVSINGFGVQKKKTEVLTANYPI